jgi:hypothetical protein
MEPNLAIMEWDQSGQSGFRLRGIMRYDPDTHEFIFPVQLTPGRTHTVTLNRKRNPREEVYVGFTAVNGPAMRSFRWSFATAQVKSATAAPAPRLVSASPASGAEVALLTPVEVTFDQPMDPAAYGVTVSEQPGRRRGPELADQVEYDAAAKRFTLLLRLPPNWNGELRLDGFRGKDGAQAEPVVLQYHTVREPVASSLNKRVEQASESAQLRALIERVREASRKITSVSENIVTSYTFRTRLPDWFGRYESQGTTFKMQGDNKFVAEIDELMHVPFRIGSDGTICWLIGLDRPMALPFPAVDEKNVSFVDPFDAKRAANVETIIRDRKLEYGGEVDFNGRRCHLVRSWAATEQPNILGPRWYIDATTLLPMRVAHGDVYAEDYTYSRINEAIPDAEFRPPAGTEVKLLEPQALPEGYTQRYLNVIDGTNGRMSVRWGIKGPKFSSGSGWN